MSTGSGSSKLLNMEENKNWNLRMGISGKQINMQVPKEFYTKKRF